MKGKKNPANQSVSRFLDDLDRRDEESQKNRIETSKRPLLDYEETRDGVKIEQNPNGEKGEYA